MFVSDQDSAFWSYQDLLLFLGLGLPCLLGGAFLWKAAILALFLNHPSKALEMLPGQFLGYLLLFAALAALIRMEYGQPFWRSLGWRWPSVPIPTLVLTGGAAALGIALLGALLHTPEVQGPMKELLGDPGSIAIVAIFGVTLGPMCEELAFRGFLQPLLVRSLGVAPGILLAGAAFGLLHLPQYGTWQHGALITLAGTGFGWARHVSKSTMGSTIMHSAYNLTLFLGFFAGGSKAPQSW